MEETGIEHVRLHIREDRKAILLGSASDHPLGSNRSLADQFRALQQGTGLDQQLDDAEVSTAGSVDAVEISIANRTRDRMVDVLPYPVVVANDLSVRDPLSCYENLKIPNVRVKEVSADELQ